MLAGGATIIRSSTPPPPVADRPPREYRDRDRGRGRDRDRGDRDRDDRDYRRPRGESGPPGEQDFALRDLVAFLAKGLVDHPDDVNVSILEAGEDAAFELHVHPDDLGHVIGKQGRTARSMRLTLGAAAARAGRRANLEIAD